MTKIRHSFEGCGTMGGFGPNGELIVTGGQILYGADGAQTTSPPIDASSAGLPEGVTESITNVNDAVNLALRRQAYEITPAMNATLAQSILDQAFTDGRGVYFRDGTHPARATLVFKTGAFIFGAGKEKTILTPDASGNHVLSATTGASLGRVTIADLAIVGAAIGTGNGIHFGTAASTSYYDINLRDLKIYSMGGCGVYDAKGMFTSRLARLDVSGNLGHQIDLRGSNTLVLEGCYAKAVPTSGKAGYRIRSSYPILIGCNGINSGDYWGIFGEDIANDGAAGASYCHPFLIGCNVEDFAVAGLLNRNEAVSLWHTSFTAPASGTVKAITFNAQPNSKGAALNVIFGTNGGSWANSRPIHCRNTAPFHTFAPGDADGSYAFYDDQGTLDSKGPASAQDYLAYATYGPVDVIRQIATVLFGAGKAYLLTNAGSPEGVVYAPVGSICTDVTNGVIYSKKTGGAGVNTGWKLVTQAA